MSPCRCLTVAAATVLTLSLFTTWGCESTEGQSTSERVGHSRRTQAVVSSRLAADPGDAPSLPDDVPSQTIRPLDAEVARNIGDIFTELVDLQPVIQRIQNDLEQELGKVESNTSLDAEAKADKRAKINSRYRSILDRLRDIDRENRVELSFADVVRRALENNYAIRVRSYDPAIETARIVEAEAQFDAVFFTNMTNNKVNQPTASELESSDSRYWKLESGVRKLLSSGMQVQVSYVLDRTEIDIFYQQLNPAWSNDLVVEFRQPLLRGFGLDFNRSQIEIRRLDRAISVERFRRDVRELVFNLEQAYWGVLQARRSVAVVARLLGDFKFVYQNLEERLGYDVYPVLLRLTESRIEDRESDFIRLCNSVRDAEDALKRLMNDPDLNLARDVQIVPTDLPSVEPLILDQIGEVSAALSHRSELHEAKLTIEQAQIGIGVAKNQALPKLDIAFRYLVLGLGPHSDAAFSELTKNDFHEYFFGLELEVPIGNRAAEAALKQARLRQAQAIMAHRDAIENVILETQQAVREVKTNYEQIGPDYRSTAASRAWVDATRARAQSKNPAELQAELDAYEALAGSRSQLLDTLVKYNVALINLERQKGTLLEYNNIVIRGPENPNEPEPYGVASDN